MSGECILVVDDHFATRDAMKQLLEEEGYEVRVAGDGVAALEILGEFPVDLVLSDMQMPRLDGPGLLTVMQRSYPGVPVILMTAQAPSVAAPIATGLGARDLVNKPLDFVDTLARISRVLAQRPGDARLA